MRLKVPSQLRALLALNIINLRKFAIPEKSESLATIYTLDIHTKSHDDLIICVGRGLVFETNLDSLVRNLHHFEVILHLLF
jgi:hypothetical protein